MSAVGSVTGSGVFATVTPRRKTTRNLQDASHPNHYDSTLATWLQIYRHGYSYQRLYYWLPSYYNVLLL